MASAWWTRLYGALAAVLLLAGAAFCISAIGTLEQCDRSCISDGLFLWTKIGTGVVAGLLVVAAGSGISLLWTRGRHTRRWALAASSAGFAIFVIWAFLAGIIWSASSS